MLTCSTSSWQTQNCRRAQNCRNFSKRRVYEAALLLPGILAPACLPPPLSRLLRRSLCTWLVTSCLSLDTHKHHQMYTCSPGVGPGGPRANEGVTRPLPSSQIDLLTSCAGSQFAFACFRAFTKRIRNDFLISHVQYHTNSGNVAVLKTERVNTLCVQIRIARTFNS